MTIEYSVNATSIIKFETKSFLGRMFSNKKPKLYSGQNFLNLGCGDMFVNGYINADFFVGFKFWKNRHPLEWRLDLRYPLNCEDEVFDGVFTEHTLEHLYPSQVESLLGELYRIMKKGAIIRITVPDLGKYVDFYCKRFAASEQQLFQDQFSTGCTAIRNIAQNYLHLSLWDYDEIRILLEKVGFQEISQKQFHEGRNPKLLLDLEERKWETLYLEAMKV